jgi:TrmH family RNA methyltransferase
MTNTLIASPSNQIIKDLVKLKSRKGERSCRSFVVEGAREIERAVRQGFTLEELFVCPTLWGEQTKAMLGELFDVRTTKVSKEAFSKVATRESSDGLLAVFKHREFTLQDILNRAGQTAPFIVVLENVEKPGNLGAILRSADGAGVHGVVILGKNIDLWNPNVIRSSLGAVFSVPTLYCPDQDSFFEWCAKRKIKTIAAVLSEKSKPIYEEVLTGPMAVALGSEANGLSKTLISKIDRSVIIPMHGICDSLNVSVAAGIFMYEVQRQRLGR